MDLDTELRTLAEFKAELQLAKVQLIEDIGDMAHIDDLEQDLLDSIDNLFDQITVLEKLEASKTDEVTLRRARLQFAALIQFFDELIEMMDSDDEDDFDEDDLEDDEEEEGCGEHGCGHCHN